MPKKKIETNRKSSCILSMKILHDFQKQAALECLFNFYLAKYFFYKRENYYMYCKAFFF